jgi:hypothetical protein
MADDCLLLPIVLEIVIHSYIEGSIFTDVSSQAVVELTLIIW